MNADAERIERIRAAMLNGLPVTHGDVHFLAERALEAEENAAKDKALDWIATVNDAVKLDEKGLRRTVDLMREKARAALARKEGKRESP